MEGYIGEIKMTGFSFSARNFVKCQGQLMAISSNTALFSLIGTMYGGDGRTTFGIPDLRGRSPKGDGIGPGLTPCDNGNMGGVEFVTLNQLEIPQHTHTASLTNLGVDIQVNNADGDKRTPGGRYLAGDATTSIYSDTVSGSDTLEGVYSVGGAVDVGFTGASQSHENRSPFTVVSFQICTFGIYPSRN